MGILDKLRISKKELIIGVIIAMVIAFILPPVGFLLLFLMFFGLLVVGVLMMIFGSKNVTSLIIAWMATRSAEKVADKFSHGRDVKIYIFV